MNGKRHVEDVNPKNSVAKIAKIANVAGIIGSKAENYMIDLGGKITTNVSKIAKLVSLKIKRLYTLSQKTNIPSSTALITSLRGAAARIYEELSSFAGKTSAFIQRYKKRIDKNGFFAATKLQIEDIVAHTKRTKKFYSSIVNYVAPVIGILVLVNIVTYTKDINYGVAVECNGQEIGVISDEDTLNEAQKVIADRVTYYDTGSELYVTAQLSVKPLAAGDELMDEMKLANAIEDQLPEISPQIDYGQEAMAGDGISDDLVRAFPITVDGEIIGAVNEYDKIDETINKIKEEYTDDSVVEVGFDKDVEYGYEQYVDKSLLVDQEEIVDKITGVEEEPVYYEVQQDDTPWDIAMENDMSVDELKDCTATFRGKQIDDITENLQVGTMIQLSAEVPYLEPTVKKELTYNETIDYDIIKNEDSSLYKGDSVVDVKGVEGEKQIHAYVTYKNGVQTNVEIIDETVLSEPVTKVMRIGTKEPKTPVSTGSGGSGSYFWPVGGGYISAYFGDGRGHKGIDIAAPYGTPIYAAASGTVTKASTGWNGGYGNVINIANNDGNVTVYAHQSSLAVSYGDYVVEGQLIGYVGSTGDSTGNHLHFEVRTNGKYNNPTSYVSQY